MNTNTTTKYVRDRLVHFDHVISQLDLHDPCPAVNRIFEELVIFCCFTQITSFTYERLIETDPVFKASCKNLNNLFSNYEYQLERYWAKMYTFDEYSILLENFPDIDDYRRSIQVEMNILRELDIQFTQSSLLNDEGSSTVTKIAFIGSGPMPISSMLILGEYAPFINIYNIDKSHEVNQLASIVSQRLLSEHLSTRMHFITCDISQRPLPSELDSILKECQLIFVAALVGDNETAKLDILQNITVGSSEKTEMKTIQHIVTRTTDGLRQVLYPKLSVEKIAMLQSTISDDQNNNRKQLLQIESIVHPQSDTRMSIVVVKKL